jgi:hypothetical protein
MVCLRPFAWMCFTVGVACAQVYPGGSPTGYPGQYPSQYPGQYPGQYPTQYPGQTGPSIPLPTRGGQKKDTKKADDAQPLPNFRGTLKQMDDKSLSLEMGDHRVLDFKLNGKTRYYRDGKATSSPKFVAGDQLSVEGQRETGGDLLAVNVYLEKDAQPRDRDGTPDTWSDDDPDRPRLTRTSPRQESPAPAPTAAPQKEAEPAAEPPRNTVEHAPKPAAPDLDDPGPPKLVRGRAADPTRERASNTAPVAPRPSVADLPINPPKVTPPPTVDEDPSPALPRTADLIRRAAAAAMDFTEALPAYVCQEVMTRYQSASSPAKWEPLDVVTAALVYENGREDYRDLTVGGKPVKKKIEEIGGAWSTGEFGTVLANLFSPATGADFQFKKDSRIAGIDAKMYDFSVARERSDWAVHVESQTYMPAYKGSVWIDPQTARVLRIEMQGHGFPEAFPIDHVESATDYQYTRLGDAKQYLLPVHSETLSCQRGSSNCFRNTIDFRNYHKYSGESSITFDTPKK